MDRYIPSSEIDDTDAIDTTGPLGIYIPPSTGERNAHSAAHRYDEGESADVVASALPSEELRGGYVRIINDKGKFFPCGFSRPIGVVVEAVVAGKKRTRSEITKRESGQAAGDNTRDNDAGDDAPNTKDENELIYQKKTITEERIHPEEALFLHMRGLLRIEPNADGGESRTAKGSELTTTGASTIPATVMSTQDLFCDLLPECEIPLAAYLAYAHLRSQGYILMRYTAKRIKLLRGLMKLEEEMTLRKEYPDSYATVSAEVKRIVEDWESMSKEEAIKDGILESNNSHSPKVVAEGKRNGDKSDSPGGGKSINGGCEIFPANKTKTENGDVSRSSKSRSQTRTHRSELSDDVATAHPPFVTPFQKINTNNMWKPDICLAYYAYKPNARFRRSNPGLPDFGVVVMPFHSFGDDNRPTFDVLSSLVLMCEGGGQPGQEENATKDIGGGRSSGISLRVVTVADSGAVVVFGVSSGGVPNVSSPKRGRKMVTSERE